MVVLPSGGRAPVLRYTTGVLIGLMDIQSPAVSPLCLSSSQATLLYSVLCCLQELILLPLTLPTAQHQ